MSRYRIGLMVLGVGTATLLHSASARGQVGEFFDGCGKLVTVDPVGCVVFVPDSGELLHNGYMRLQGWDGHQVGDRFHVAGLVENCGSPCDPDGCFDADSVLGACVPAVSAWGVLVLALMLLIAATILIRTAKAHRYNVRIFTLFIVGILGTPAQAEDPAITQKVDSMLAHPHESERMLVRFKQGVQQITRDALHTAAGAVKLKSYRFVDGLTLVEVPGGDLSAALTTYLSDTNVLYAEPAYLIEAAQVPNDTHFSLLWGMQNTGQNSGTYGADIRAVEAWNPAQSPFFPCNSSTPCVLSVLNSLFDARE